MSLNNTNNDFQNRDEIEEDPEDTLRSLFNLKKYKINNLCHRNLFTIGWNILGENMEEDRRWTHMLLIQEREQIKDDVQ